MENSGGGVTFTEEDLQNAKGVVGLLSKASFEMNAVQIMQAAAALSFARNLIPMIEANLFEIKSMIKAPEGG